MYSLIDLSYLNNMPCAAPITGSPSIAIIGMIMKVDDGYCSIVPGVSYSETAAVSGLEVSTKLGS